MSYPYYDEDETQPWVGVDEYGIFVVTNSLAKDAREDENANQEPTETITRLYPAAARKLAKKLLLLAQAEDL